ncbi:hypothetical protein GUJ93_ZPchr0003g17794 [Zizania palustris]|uniref:Uncharacterized protein n=1 Tax=Zizania palustris TaxID=103762 RepID=A0A8J5SWH7_ZIZPA|nr:hypothetical protein GUJ93_ZPchr0003g17794 [Zizania palustris]
MFPLGTSCRSANNFVRDSCSTIIGAIVWQNIVPFILSYLRFCPEKNHSCSHHQRGTAKLFPQSGRRLQHSSIEPEFFELLKRNEGRVFYCQSGSRIFFLGIHGKKMLSFFS